ncbi:hypothetical protein DRN43_00570 [Thermococci archaeon]|nr:MAG: hypothetical protein DRN43_00570 [Thermococci archaeon]
MSSCPNDPYYYKLKENNDEDMADLAVMLGAISHFFNYVEVEIERHPPAGEDLDRPATSIKAIFNLPSSETIINSVSIKAGKDFRYFHHKRDGTVEPIYVLFSDITVRMESKRLESKMMYSSELAGALQILGFETNSANSYVAFLIQSFLLIVLASEAFQPPLKIELLRDHYVIKLKIINGKNKVLASLEIDDLDTEDPNLSLKLENIFDSRIQSVLKEIFSLLTELVE